MNQGKISRDTNKESQGYDVLIRRGNTKKKIEVKFIDSFLKSGKYKKYMGQKLTAKEKIQCDVVVIVDYGEVSHEFYIIPRSKLNSVLYKNNTFAIYKGVKESKGKMSNFKVKSSNDWNRLLL